jgi:hypothetical protein
MDPIMQVISFKIKSVVMESITTRTDLLMKVNGLMICTMDKVNANTEMEDCTMDNGKKERNAEWVKYII